MSRYASFLWALLLALGVAAGPSHADPLDTLAQQERRKRALEGDREAFARQEAERRLEERIRALDRIGDADRRNRAERRLNRLNRASRNAPTFGQTLTNERNQRTREKAFRPPSLFERD